MFGQCKIAYLAATYWAQNNLELQDTTSAEYLAALHEAHEQCAERLLHLCSRNGGIYVKAAQFLASLQSIPEVYRRHAPATWS